MDWPGVSGATGYEVQQRDGSGANPGWNTLVPDSDPVVFAGSSAVISGLVNGNIYSHRVRSIRGIARSDWSEQKDTSLPSVRGTLSGFTSIALHGTTTITASLSPDYATASLSYTNRDVITTART